jgi:hypothetical protein
MKKTLLTVAKAGLNLSTIKYTIPNFVVGNGSVISMEEKNDLAFGFHFGGFAEIRLSHTFALQPEILYSAQGSKFNRDDNQEQVTLVPGFPDYKINITTITNTETTLKTNYFNIPLLAKFYATKRLFFMAGPQFGFLLNAYSLSTGAVTTTQVEIYNGNPSTPKIVTTNLDTSGDAKENFNIFNLSLGLGGGYFFTKNIFAEARYNFGLTNDAYVKYTDIIKPEAKASNIQFSVGYRF